MNIYTLIFKWKCVRQVREHLNGSLLGITSTSIRDTVVSGFLSAVLLLSPQAVTAECVSKSWRESWNMKFKTAGVSFTDRNTITPYLQFPSYLHIFRIADPTGMAICSWKVILFVIYSLYWFLPVQKKSFQVCIRMVTAKLPFPTNCTTDSKKAFQSHLMTRGNLFFVFDFKVNIFSLYGW